MNTTNPLTRCHRCDRHTNPVTANQYVNKNRGVKLPSTGNPDALVCEYCGWKLHGVRS
jgi:hypothetical protein